MTLVHVSEDDYKRLKAQDEDCSGVDMEDYIYGWARIRWFEAHGPGYFLACCCGEAAIPEGLIPGPDAPAVAHRNSYG